MLKATIRQSMQQRNCLICVRGDIPVSYTHLDSVDFLVIPDDIILLHLVEESDLDLYSADGSSLVVEVILSLIHI